MKSNPASLATALRRDNLAAFVIEAIRYLNPGQDLVMGPHIPALCYELERVLRADNTLLLVTMPPRFLKSTITSVAFVAWALGHDPSLRFICVSYSANLAEKFSRDVREIMTSNWYKKTFPKTCLNPKRISAEELCTTAGGGRVARGLTGSITGMGADIIILDDPLNANDISSEAERRKVLDAYSNVLPTRVNNPKLHGMITVAQRLHVDDLPGRLIEEGGWHHLNLPMTALTAQDIAMGNGKIWHREPGGLLLPNWFGPEEVEKFRKKLGRANYAAQYDQAPEMPDGNLFKLSAFKRFTKWPPGPIEAFFQSWDTSNSVGENSAYSACTIWAVVGQKLYLVYAYRAHLNFMQIIEKMEEFREKYNTKLCLVEAAASGHMLVEEMRRRNHDWVQAVPVMKDKITRAEAQLPKIEQGRVYLPSESTGDWHIPFEREIAMFPSGRYSDWVDSMTQFLRTLDQFAYWGPIRELSMNKNDRPGFQLLYAGESRRIRSNKSYMG